MRCSLDSKEKEIKSSQGHGKAYVISILFPPMGIYYFVKYLFFTGGDTAIKAAQCLNVSGTIIRDEILPGIVYGNFIEEQYKNIIVITKAGGFGAEDAIWQVLKFLNNR